MTNDPGRKYRPAITHPPDVFEFYMHYTGRILFNDMMQKEQI